MHASLFPVLPTIKNFDHFDISISNYTIWLSLWCRVITRKCIVCSLAVLNIFVYQLFTFHVTYAMQKYFSAFHFWGYEEIQITLTNKVFLKRPFLTWVDLKWPMLAPPKVVLMALLRISSNSTLHWPDIIYQSPPRKDHSNGDCLKKDVWLIVVKSMKYYLRRSIKVQCG